ETSLLDDTRWRDELAMLNMSSIEPQDRTEVVDMVIRLLFDIMLEKKDKGRARITAVLAALAGCTEEELGLLVTLMVQPIKGERADEESLCVRLWRWTAMRKRKPHRTPKEKLYAPSIRQLGWKRLGVFFAPCRIPTSSKDVKPSVKSQVSDIVEKVVALADSEDVLEKHSWLIIRRTEPRHQRLSWEKPKVDLLKIVRQLMRLIQELKDHG
ncbi:hypothetical protein MPER_07806, partial [Moniliophthora perniciosa FA553]